VKGLDAFAGAHPPVAPLFYSFRLMVDTGLLMLVVSGLGWWQPRPNSRRSPPSPTLTAALVAMSFSGWVAVIAGWYITEIGRQPWLVYGVLKTAQAAGPVPASSIGLTLSVYLALCLALYLALTVAYVAAAFRLARKGAAVDPRPAACRALAAGRQVSPA